MKKTGKILIVEDDCYIRQDVVGAFQARGWIVLEAGRGREALDLIRSSGGIDALLTDINLGDAVTGWDVAEAGRISWPDVAVVYASAFAANQRRLVPGSLFFGKPYDTDAIIAACEQLTSRH